MTGSLTSNLSGMGVLSTPVSAAGAPLSAAAAERSLRAAVGDSLTVRRGADGVVRQLGTRVGRPIPRAKDGSADDSALSFLSTYGALFGLRDPATQLRVQRRTALPGGEHVSRFEQLAGDLPVLGGELVVTTDRAGNVLSVGGETARTMRSPEVSVTAAAARTAALRVTAKSHQLSAKQLRSDDPILISYDPSLLGAPGRPGATPVWRVDVRGPYVRELVLVDVGRPRIVLHINQIAAATNRLVCDFANAEVNDYTCKVANQTRVEGQAPVLPAEVNKAYDHTGATATYYLSNFGADLTAMIGTVPAGGAAKALRVSTRVCFPGEACPLDNAFWDGEQTTYGEGYGGAQDVVAHELTHGVTEKTSNLFYGYQSGAINESMSDVFGELIDLSDGVNLPDSTDNWFLGEDAPGGVVRSMSDPSSYGQPDKMTSPNYYPFDGDSGGVHTNSGVGNKAAYLIGRGGTFNGQAVTGLGLTKTAAIYYRTLNLLATGADYADLGATLSSSCRALVGSAGIAAADCIEVDHAVTATEMAQQPTNPGAAVPEAPVCSTGQPSRWLFADNMESSVNWSATGTTAGWGYADGYATSGKRSLNGYTPEASGAAQNFGVAQAIPLFVTAGQLTYLRFRHYKQFELDYDGGQVQYSVNSGSTWADAGTLPTDNGYDSDIYLNSGTVQFRGFGGQSAGYVSSRINVSSLAGNTVLFRFRISGDESVRSDWLVDDVSLYECGTTLPPPLPRPTRADYNGDGRADTAVWRPSTGSWLIPGLVPTAFGKSGDVAQVGDFTGDIRSDLAVWRPSNGTWYVSGLPAVSHGVSTDRPVAADYTGDGKTDIAVWRPSNGTWYVRGQSPVAFGAADDIPVAADFTGDSRAELAVWRPSNGTWYVRGQSAVAFGKAGDRPTVADFTGDGKADFAVWRPSNGTWYVRNLSATAFGVSSDVPVAGDFTGDGRADIAVWRSSNGTWYVRNVSTTPWGGPGDVPLR